MTIVLFLSFARVSFSTRAMPPCRPQIRLKIFNTHYFILRNSARSSVALILRFIPSLSVVFGLKPSDFILSLHKTYGVGMTEKIRVLLRLFCERTLRRDSFRDLPILQAVQIPALSHLRYRLKCCMPRHFFR